LPGARAIAETLRRRGIPVAVSSNSPRRFVDTALRSAGLHDLFEVLVSAEDAEHGKPAPDLYLAACSRLAAAPGRSVAFEDSSTGVASARAAGMFVIAVPSAPAALLDAHLIYDSLTHPDLVAWMAVCMATDSQANPQAP
jgi:HAD superfamily hydrolase (TIGR01509 family)